MDEPNAEIVMNVTDGPVVYRGETILAGTQWTFVPPSTEPPPPGIRAFPIHVPAPAHLERRSEAMDERGLTDKAFYWVRCCDGWLVARWRRDASAGEPGYFYLTGHDVPWGLGEMEEIGPCIGAGPLERRREFVDGAFYWVRRYEEWMVLKCVLIDGEPQWDCPGLLATYVGVDEIGPCLGTEPPGWDPSCPRELSEDVPGSGGH